MTRSSSAAVPEVDEEVGNASMNCGMRWMHIRLGTTVRWEVGATMAMGMDHGSTEATPISVALATDDSEEESHPVSLATSV
eukprot:CAMPEP_0201927348 /NCGR_PEP_ID=MMETSP0903-20130614/18504_1 /ASSEMBLY_ACC=CAM_ASM_000552 /TAXON_ID=420261 /ORGANISM="Thalassiosira antarctica, Strain CCMP982" /LENGTH=80 /DNA_ID=CAMNT_0048465513 /DNA_START=22 /DNA_END=261 /DNA_ORIENTATION=-